MSKEKRNWKLDEKQMVVFQNLWRQVEKAFDYRKNLGQGYRGKERYREALRAFCKHLTIQYRPKHLRNISDMHLSSFINASVEAGVSPKTIKTDLAAIRKLHGRLEGARYVLSDNSALGYTDRRSTRGIDRAWQEDEVRSAVTYAKATGREDVSWAIGIGRNCGLRIEEVTALTKTQIRNALAIGHISITVTKGGIPRDVPLDNAARNVLREILKMTERERIFIEHGKSHHQVFKSIQNWIYNHRRHFQSIHIPDDVYKENLMIDEERPSLTFHGLRHAFAREQYNARIQAGKSQLVARKEVALLLGHGRDDVTRIYLSPKGSPEI